jgi:3-oxoacyl-[acyl-carrier protein] reductase
MTTPAGQVVVVTGGAGGRGRAIAQRFAQAGAHAVLADLDREAGELSARALQVENLPVSFEPLDVRDPEQSRRLVERVAAAHGGIDVWVNSASVFHVGAAETLSNEAWEDSLRTMLSGSFYCAQAAGAHMLGRGWGVIINIASVDAFRALEGRAAYGAAKAGLVALTRALGIEWAARGVRVVGIAPGELLAGEARSGKPSEVEALHVRRTPLRRLGTVEELAEAVFFLASDEAAFIVGETMRVDGGWTAYHLF